MRTLLSACFLLTANAAFAVDSPAKKAEPPHAVLEFSRDVTLKQWTTTFELTTTSGANYEITIPFGERGNNYDERAMEALLTANWMVEVADRNVRIHGVRKKDGTADAVKELTITNLLVKGEGRTPTLSAVGDAKVTAKDADKPVKADPKRKTPPAGPKFPGETFVEVDFGVLPAGTACVFWEFKWDVRTTAGKEEPNLQFKFEVNSDEAAENCLLCADSIFWDCSYKIEAVGKTKLRIYGAVLNGRYYPAENATIESPQLKANQLPKVTPPKRG